MKTSFQLGLWFSLAGALGAALSARSVNAQSPGLPELAPSMTRKASNVADEADKAVNVRLISESSVLVPGRTSTIGVNFDIAPGWNLYWRNAGDSGLPITVKFETPEGLTIGEPMWPTPERHVLPGDLLDYTYTRRVTLLFPVTLSASSTPNSGPVKIKAVAKWLVCKEACVPGERAIELSLPIASSSSASADADLIASARARLPLTLSEQPAPIIRVAWQGRTLELACTAAEELMFFPYEGDTQPEDALQNGSAKRESLRLSYQSAETGQPVRGVLQVKRLGNVTYHLIEAPAVPSPPHP